VRRLLLPWTLLSLSSGRGACGQKADEAVVIAELMYHPPAADGAELARGLDSASAFEYVKLAAPAGASVDLAAGTAFTAGVAFTFEAPLRLEVGGFVVIAADRAAFDARYGPATPGQFLCCFGGNLGNGGEALVLADLRGGELARAEYTDEDPAADGAGAALALRDGVWRAVEPGPHCRWGDPWSGIGGREPTTARASVVINELHYKPKNSVVNEQRDSARGGSCQTDFVWKRSGDLDEFVELHNPTRADIDLAGWQLAEGVAYTFPADPRSAFTRFCKRCRSVLAGEL
jgi:hypothetical protein